MKKLPNKVSAGDSIKAKDFNDMVDYLRSITLREGTGYRVNTSAGGTSLNVRPSVGGGGSVAPVVKPRPLEVTLSRPSYIDPETLPIIDPETQFMFWVYAGNVEGTQLDNIRETFIGQKSSLSTRVYMQCTMGQLAEISVTGLSIVIDTTPSGLPSATPFNEVLKRPEMINVELAQIISRDGAQTLVSSSGNITVSDVLTTISSSGDYILKVIALRV